MRSPRLYLVSPPLLGEDAIAAIAGLVAGHDIACVRIAVAARSEEQLRSDAQRLREALRGEAVDLVIAEHFRLVGPLALDGVHLADGARTVREARRHLEPDAIVGAHCRASRHEGMTAAEIGADYVSFGPLSPTPLGDGTTAPPELFAWWAEMIETPVVAEGGITPALARAVAGQADFLALGEELWSHPAGPETALGEILAAIGAAPPTAPAS